MRRQAAASLMAAIVALNACADQHSPAALADQTTKAVYNVDIDGAEAQMDDDLKSQITRASVGDLSDKMHALGGYKGVKQTAGEPQKGVYAFEADFDRGALTVNLRVDPTGKIAAYRVTPQSR